MEIVQLVLDIIILISIFAFAILTKVFIPSYFRKKGENIATKEDIAEITKKTEEVQKEFKQQFELFSSDVRFKYDFYYRQYSELYCKLYAVIVQSEYVRHFIEKREDTIISFDDAPFVEIQPTQRYTRTQHIDGEKSIVESKVESIVTDISSYNKKYLTDLIINNGEYASQELLKLAVSYRFAYEFYSGSKRTPNDINELCQLADEEEYQLIRALVICIVKEYNYLRKELKMAYDEDEATSGKLNYSFPIE